MEQLGLLTDNRCYVEMGAGKGMLGTQANHTAVLEKFYLIAFKLITINKKCFSLKPNATH